MKKGNRVRFNIGGKIFETTTTTLAAAGPDSFFGPLLTDKWNRNTAMEEDDEVFIDRNPDCFAVILDLLRTGELSIPPHVGKDSLIREAQFYGVVDLVQGASWGSPLNVDLALTSSSVKCLLAQPSAAKMIFGSPNGGFCVANDKSVYVYDWILHEHPPIHLEDYGRVNEALWVGTNNIAISTTETVGMFNAATGKLQHKFVDQRGNQVCGATYMCLSDSNIFHLCKNDYTAIGVLDNELGESIGTLFLRFPNNEPVIPTYVEKVWRPINLQMLDGTSNCLVATHAISNPQHFNGDYIEAQIIDTRDSQSVYNRSWSSRFYKQDNPLEIIRGATLMEDRNSVCVISSDGAVGFLDLRFTGDVQWSSKKVGKCTSRKLMYSNDKIFMLSSGQLLVYSVPNLVITSNNPRNGGGGNSIFEVEDFSISGDRLLLLQSKTNLVQVWETPRPCLTVL